MDRPPEPIISWYPLTFPSLTIIWIYPSYGSTLNLNLSFPRSPNSMTRRGAMLSLMATCNALTASPSRSVKISRVTWLDLRR